MSGRAHILASSFYLQQKEYETSANIAEAGLAFLEQLEGEIGRTLPGCVLSIAIAVSCNLNHARLEQSLKYTGDYTFYLFGLS